VILAADAPKSFNCLVAISKLYFMGPMKVFAASLSVAWENFVTKSAWCADTITAGQVEWLPAFSAAMASSVMRNQISRHVARDARQLFWIRRIWAAIAWAYGRLKTAFYG
jgi:hypothetical protein